MKKSSLVVTLSISIMTLVLSSSSYAVNESEKMPRDEADQKEIEVEIEQPIEYTLPYPGILPDHPLYPLKKFRDRLLDFLIRDPVKRIEFNLLMSDKRYNMGIFFSDEKKFDRAYTIIAEGESFYGQIPEEMQTVKDEQHTISPDLLQKIKTAAGKHREITITIKNKSPEDLSEGYQEILDQIDQSVQKIEERSK